MVGSLRWRLSPAPWYWIRVIRSRLNPKVPDLLIEIASALLMGRKADFVIQIHDRVAWNMKYGTLFVCRGRRRYGGNKVSGNGKAVDLLQMDVVWHNLLSLRYLMLSILLDAWISCEVRVASECVS
jgi:hypothetical protein